MKKKSIIFLIAFVLFIVPAVCAEQHMKLLAVEESSIGSVGTIADLGLKTVKGKGEVYTATFPLTEMDTQISTRIAKDIACEYADLRCDDTDFLYTIKSDSSIIGGPSGGAALSVLTLAELKGKKVDDKMSITGTINSGGLIGPVGGLMPKIEAAASEGLKTVLIPKGTRYFDKTDEENNTETIDLVEFGKGLNVTVVEVSTIGEAYSYFVHETYVEERVEVDVDESYQQTMKMLAEMLCNRTKELEIGLDKETENNVMNLTSKAKESFDKQEYYSAASYCFGANLKYQEVWYSRMSHDETDSKIKQLYSRVENFKIKDYDSITDLQIYMVVKERLYEAEKWLDMANESLGKSKLADAQKYTAYANERVYSAEVWSSFFDNNDKKIFFSQEMLNKGCMTKLGEARERVQYVKIYFPDLVKETVEELMQAETDLDIGQYELCMFKAAKAKAEADVILSVMGVKKEYLDSTIDEKLKVVIKQIAKKDHFPIVAYSYYVYSESLKHEDDKYSALLYAEYALELANLELYYNIDGEKLDLEAKEKVVIAILVILLILISHYHIRKA